MSIQSGEWVTISSNKEKKHYFSYRIHILIILLLVGIVPVIFMWAIPTSSYADQLLDNQLIKVRNDYNIQADQLGGTLLRELEPAQWQELTWMSEYYEGRVLIVDDMYRVVRDSYGIDVEKYCISDRILRAFQGESFSYINHETEYVEVVVPITMNRSEGKQITGVLVASASIDWANVLAVEQTQRSFWLLLIAIIAIVVIAIFMTSRLVKPWSDVIGALDQVSNGSLESEFIIESQYQETQEIEKRFRRVQVQMQQLDESRQEFVSNVSHELKTPITSIRVLADSLLSEENVPVELYREFMSDISEEIDRESKIINDLLALVKLDKQATEINIESVNINELIELILKRVRPIARQRNIEIVFESFRPVIADVDEVKFSLALTNLVENAVKYNNDEGWVRASLNADHKYFYIKIVDSGVGIPEDAREHIFDRFYRVDKARSRETGGTGLGLAITKSVILLHRGAIKVESEMGEGTTFTVRVPLKYTV